MHVQFGPDHDGCHDLATDGAYEWWYVDAIDVAQEWSFVVILFRGMPMSPDYLAALARGEAHPTDHCGYSVTVYHRGRRIAMAFRGVPMASCSFATTTADVVVEDCVFRRQDDGSYALSVDVIGNGSSQRVALKATLRPPANLPPRPAVPAETHGWVLVAPDCAFEGVLSIAEGPNLRVKVTISGRAYHDHNYGARPMQCDFRAWHWGRWHVDGRTFVYLAAPDATTPFVWAGWCHTDGTVAALTAPSLTIERQGVSPMGVRYPRSLVVTGMEPDGAPLAVRVRQERVLDDAPFYRRWMGQATIAGAVCDGISEYMAVDRLSQAWIRPFLRLPWQL